MMPAILGNYSVLLRVSIEKSTAKATRSFLISSAAIARQRSLRALSSANDCPLNSDERKQLQDEELHFRNVADALDRVNLALADGIRGVPIPEPADDVLHAYELADCVSPDPTRSRAGLRALRLECERLRLLLYTRETTMPEDFQAPAEAHALMRSASQ